MSDYSAMTKPELARELSSLARDCLSVAIQDGGKDPELLALASRHALQAIALDAGFAEPYLSLAYLALLTGLADKAVELLKSARKLDPKDPRIAYLLKAAQGEQQRTENDRLPPLRAWQSSLLGIRLAEPTRYASRARRLDGLKFLSRGI